MKNKPLEKVGIYKAVYNSLTGQNLPCSDIMQSPGLKIHIQKRHPSIVHQMYLIPKIIANPHYVGCDPTKPCSIELVKKLSEHFLVSITLDTRNGYLFVSSFYDISKSKVERRLNSGRLKRIHQD